MTREAMFATYKRLKSIKQGRLWLSMINGQEEDLWAAPVKADMEDTGSLTPKPYSIPAFVNEFANGLYVSSNTGQWTTKMGINPSTYSAWKPQRVLYGSDYASATDNTWQVWGSLDEMAHLLQFDQLPIHPEYSEKRSGNALYACSKYARKEVMRALRVGQDLFLGNRQDGAYPNPMYDGIEFVYVSELNDKALYPTDLTPSTSEALVIETAASLDGPRFYALNLDYLVPFWHTERYFKFLQPDRPLNQPTTTVLPVDMWHNIGCRSLRHQGILAPGA
jgi:hypothetical protein